MAKNINFFDTLYSNYKEAFLLGLMKVKPVERKVFFDEHFVEITGFTKLKPNRWIDLDSTSLIQFLQNDEAAYALVRKVFYGEYEEDIASIDLEIAEDKHVQVKIVINNRNEEGQPTDMTAVFINAAYIENTVNELNRINAIFESSQEISLASTWWADYSVDTEYFYQSDNGAIMVGLEPSPDKRYSIADYQQMRENAAQMDEEYRKLVDAEIATFRAAANGETDTFGGRTPLLTPQGKIIWIDSRGKVILRSEDGLPRFVVAVDIMINDQVEKEQELFKLQSLIDEGLSNSNIGVWWHEYEDGHYYFNQTKSYREVMGIDELLDRDEDSLQWAEYIKDFRKRYPVYNEYFDKDAQIFADCLEGKSDGYTSIIPVLTSEDKIKWIEVRSTVIRKDEQGRSLLMVGVNVDVTDRLESEELISELQHKNFALNNANRSAIETAGLLVWTNDKINQPNNTHYYANQLYINTLGMTVNNEGLVSVKELEKTMYPDEEGEDGFRVLMSKNEFLLDNKIKSVEGILVKHQNLLTGAAVYLEHNASIQEVNEYGEVTAIGGYIRNLTEQVLIERENKKLNLENVRLLRADKLAIKSGQVMVWYKDNNEFDGTSRFFGNDVFNQVLGIVKDDNGLYDMNDFRRSIYRLNDEALELATNLRSEMDAIDEGTKDSYEKVLVIHKNISTGELIYLEHYSEVESRYEDGYVHSVGGFMINVTEAIKRQKQIEFLANHDSLTNLYNRNFFEHYTANSLPMSYTLLVFDSDGLKLVNDAFGHIEGDKVIQFVSGLLYDHFHKDSVVTRIGGDEFTIISTELMEDEIQRRYDAINRSVDEFNQNSDYEIDVSYGHRTVIEEEVPFNTAFNNAENLMYRRKLKNRKTRKVTSLESILRTLNQSPIETSEHSLRLTEYTTAIMKQLGFSRDNELKEMRLLSRVHDVGKITIPSEILLKPERLTVDEYEIVKQHSEAGYKIIRNIIDSDVIADGVLYHHERYDGKGYPFGLSGRDIPLYARILSVCDAYDAMTIGRPYAEKRSMEEAIEELRAHSNTQFDGEVVEAFIKTLK